MAGHGTVYDDGLNRMVHAPTKKHGGRFGGPEEQRVGKASRKGLSPSGARKKLPSVMD